MALTASATPRCAQSRQIAPSFLITPLSSVQADITRSLKMSSDNLFKVVHSFNRENLFYEVPAMQLSGHQNANN